MASVTGTLTHTISSVKPSVVAVGHPPTLSALDVLQAVGGLVVSDAAPLVVQTFPSERVQVAAVGTELGLALLVSIAQLIHNLHAGRSAPALSPANVANVQYSNGTPVLPAGGSV